MAKKVDAIPPKSSCSNHPWDEWLDGDVWCLEPVDLKCSPEYFRRYALSAARFRGKKVTVRKRGDNFYIQAFDKPTEGNPEA